MTSLYTMGFIDESGEFSSTRFNMPTLTGANYEGTFGNDPGDVLGDTRLAVAPLTLCNFTNHVVQAVKYADTAIAPTDQDAEREVALIIVYQGSPSGKKYRWSIPGPDRTKFLAGTDKLDLTDPDVAAFIAHVEANLVTELGETLTVLRGYKTSGAR
jgi:hypothetical protein